MNKFEKGQVLPLGLVLIVIGVVGALVLFNTSQVATDKMRLANSADAAAYSGALWQARALNYQAYTNRAMLANQVAIAQAVSLQSWMSYAVVASSNVSTATKTIPGLNVVTGGIEGVAAAAEVAVSIGATAMLMASNAATKALSLSQSAMHVATLVNTAEIISVVASESDQRFTTNSAYGLLSKAANVSEWVDFNTQYTNKDTSAMKERQQLIMQSRDKFTSARNWDLFDWWIPVSPTRLFKLMRQGTTKLVSVKTPQGLKWEWVAKDTISIQKKRYGFFGKKLSELPIAWASAYANSRSSKSRIKRQGCGLSASFGFSVRKCPHFTEDNHGAEELADKGIRSLSGRRSLEPMYGYGGVRSFWVLSDDARASDDARLRVRVEVSLPVDQVRASDAVLNADTLSSPVVVAGHTLSSVSAADVFYRRPQHHYIKDSEREKANAYNPYWQAQLSPVSKLELLAAVALRSGGDSPTTISGEVQ